MLQMSQVLQNAQKYTRPPARESRGGNGVLNASGDASAPFATLDKTVSAFVGDVPGGSLERLGKPSRILTVICSASMSEPRHPLCRRYHTRLVGLRRSLVSIGLLHAGRRAKRIWDRARRDARGNLRLEHRRRSRR